MFPASAAEVVPRTKQNVSARKTMATVFSASTQLLVLNSIAKVTKFNQDSFIDAVLPDLQSEKARIVRRKGLQSLSVHIDNSMCHNGAKITEKHGKKHVAHLFTRPQSARILVIWDLKRED
jgi:hypothetical protein